MPFENLTEEEMLLLDKVLCSADSGCSNCVTDMFEQMQRADPNHNWANEPNIGEEGEPCKSRWIQAYYEREERGIPDPEQEVY
jgi:hypothetical protein